MASGAFDILASDYDRTWTNSGVGTVQRNAVWRHIVPLFRPGDNILDLGCGTGEDAVQLARAGVAVRAVDASPEMVRIARNRGVNAEVQKIENIAELPGTFDGVISNFGALNCVENLAPLRDSLAQKVKTDGHLVFCLMSRFCLIESLYFLRTLRFGKAARRWWGQTYAETLRLKVFYPAAGQVQRAMAPEFELLRTVGIGIAVPPSYISGLSPASLRRRTKIDQCVAHWPFFRSMGDHQLFIFIRK